MKDHYFRPINLSVNGQVAKRVYINNNIVEFSWQIDCDDPNFVQSAYQIIVYDDRKGIIWDSNKVFSSCQHWIKVKLNSDNKRVNAKVKIFNQDDVESQFSLPIEIEKTLEDNSQWGNAQWIWYDRNNYTRTAPSPYFRKTFNVKENFAEATLYVTARGVFEASINGKLVSEDLLAPGWTDFKQHIPFLTYDLTDKIEKGENTFGAIIADGWCCGNLAITRMRNFYHSHPEFLAKIEITYLDGSKDFIVTDSTWKATTGPILSSDLYDGEDYDGRYELGNWNENGYDDSAWIPVALGEFAKDSPPLVAKMSPPVRYIEELKPIKLLSPKKDVFIWDFGQNFSGTFRVRFRAHKGRVFTFRTGEMLDTDGTLYTLNYRGARSYDTYICGQNINCWNTYTPKFTFHGYRYLQIDGFQFDNLDVNEIEVTGLVMHSKMEQVGSFECGNPLVSRLYLNALWGQKSNFLEIPTDCPQRDERLGWTGDAQIFAPTAMLNMDCTTFYRKYLRDIREAMKEDGASPSIAPAVLRLLDGAAAWGDAIILMPYEIYRHYGWKTILEENFEAMKKSIDYQKNTSNNLIIETRQFGDWLAFDKTDNSLVATAYFAHCTEIFAKVANILNKLDDYRKYSKLALEIRKQFRNKFLDEQKIPIQRTQTAIVLAVMFDLIEADELKENADALEQAVLATDCKISTGFIGTSMILQALCKCKLEKLACDLLLQEECPSWLFSVKQGATTIWERWDSYTLKDGFGNVTMNSFNHYAYGAVASFMINYLAGIQYVDNNLTFKIIPDKRFAPVKGSFRSPYGLIESHWDYDNNGKLSWAVTVPHVKFAKAILPDGQEIILQSGKSILL